MKLDQNHSFSDHDVTAWVLDENTLQIRLTGVYWSAQIHQNVTLLFWGVKHLSCMTFNHDRMEWVTLSRIEPLKDICKFYVKSESHYVLEGFGSKSGQWISIDIVAKNASVEW